MHQTTRRSQNTKQILTEISAKEAKFAVN